MIGRSPFRIAMAAVLVWAFLEYAKRCYFEDEEDAHFFENETEKERFFSSALEKAASSYDAEKGAYVWGRTNHPSFLTELHPLNWIQRFLVKKEFVWMSATSGDWLLGFAVLHFNYQSTMVVHLYNAKEHINLKQQMDVLLSPLTMAGGEWVANDKGEVGPTAAGHKVTFRSFFLSPNQGSAEIHFTSTGIHFNLNVSGRSGQWIRASGATAETPRMTGLVYPLGKKRPAVVYKTSAVPLASLSIEYQRSASEPVVTAPLVSPSFLSMDYTRGLLRRHTEWMWASVCTREVGMHLSSGTYDVDGYSLENAFFAPHSPPQFLNEKVEFVKLEGETTDKWAIRGRNVSLTFTAFDGYGGKVNLGLVNVSLDHRWGLYDGYVLVNNTRLDLHQTPGVFEDHYALW